MFSAHSTANETKSFDDQAKAFWYFFGGIIVFGFYITNLFVGVMFEAFLSYKNMDSKGSLISQAERRWRDYEKRLCQVRPLDQFVWGINHQHRVRLPPLPFSGPYVHRHTPCSCETKRPQRVP